MLIFYIFLFYIKVIVSVIEKFKFICYQVELIFCYVYMYVIKNNGNQCRKSLFIDVNVIMNYALLSLLCKIFHCPIRSIRLLGMQETQATNMSTGAVIP